jgi:hypothetical protein
MNFRCPATRGLAVEYASSGWADTVIDNNVIEIEGAQPRQAGNIDSELVGIGPSLMMRIDPAFRAKEVFCGPCIECVHRQRLGACHDINTVTIS